MEYYSVELKDIYKELRIGERGLKGKEAYSRLRKFGLNKLEEKEKISPLTIFIKQFKGAVVWILVIAVLISFLIGEKLDAIVIAAILVINAILGFIQEYRAEKSLEVMKKLAPKKARVLRDGRKVEVDVEKIVPGDIIFIEEGDKVPADSRLIENIGIATLEASLTGESTPISKNTAVLKEKTPLADRKNMLFSSTIIARGKGKAVVVETGMNSEIGKIAELIQETKDEETPLQKKLDNVGKKLGVLTVVIVAIVFTAQILRGGDLFEIFITSIALAVAAIPEGLPAIVTISLALGTQRMVKKNALLKNLPSVETLGGTTVICSDKTGTLTKNEMTVTELYCNNKFLDVNKEIKEKNLDMLLTIGALCNNASIEKGKLLGDPTEACLIASAEKAVLKKEQLEKNYKRIKEIPFTSERKMMTTVHKGKGKIFALTKGAPDVVLKKCNRILVNNRIKRLNEKDKKEILKAVEKMAKKALRVLGFAYSNKDNEKEMVFVGLQGMIDPPREEVKEAIKKCEKAGIRVVMITGDHKETAIAIAKELGIKGDAVEGKDLEKINLNKIVNKVAVYARVNPIHKNKIVAALRRKGHVVAMTGDGVNDAPALKKADIGIAMGITGTDVSKEASDMILMDDNFSSIVNAVEEGRGIYDNIKKFINYLLSCNFGEILVLFLASLIGWPIPLLALQILWINLVTDGLPAVALGIDPISKGAMGKKPRNPKANIIDKKMVVNIIMMGVMIAVATLFLFHRSLGNGVEHARTVAFTTLVVLEIVRLQIIRSDYNTGMFSNKYLIIAVISSIALQLIVLYTPLSYLFNTVPLALIDWGYIVSVGIVLSVIGYFVKKSKIMLYE